MINDINWSQVEDQYIKNGVTFIDNVLDENSIQALRNFALSVDFRHDVYNDYSALEFSRDGIWPHVLDNIVVDLERIMSMTFKRGWFFIYNNISEGVKIHVDPLSEMTVNLWVTPDECMEGGTGYNGLDVWKIKPKPEWGYDISNGNTQLCEEYIKESNPEKVTIEYKFNRAAIFNSDYLHQSQPVWTKDGADNRKINYALLFERTWKLG